MQTKLTMVFALASGLAASHALADNLGRFTRPSTGATVDFYDCGGNLCGSGQRHSPQMHFKPIQKIYGRMCR